MTNIKLGICPIGWTNDDMPDLGKENTFQQCVSEMALAGFTGCEMVVNFQRCRCIKKSSCSTWSFCC